MSNHLITPGDLEDDIAHEYYFTGDNGVDGADIAAIRAENPTSATVIEPLIQSPDLPHPLVRMSCITFCCLVLKNGFVITGISACAHAENFDTEKGRKYAREDAIRQLWAHHGYLLRTRIMAEEQFAQMASTIGATLSEAAAVIDSIAQDQGDVMLLSPCVSFGAAQSELRAGRKVARRGWNGKGMWIAQQNPDLHSTMTLPYLYIEYPEGHPAYPKGARVPWLASQTDLMARDWYVVE